MTLATGTSGWRRLVDFYPPRTRESDMLAVYAETFSLVEIDSTFQGIPHRHRFVEWAAAVPEDFRFHVLAFGGLTLHQRRPGTTIEAGVSWHEHSVEAPGVFFTDFVHAVEPLGSRLAAVTLQFPPWFTASYESEGYLSLCQERLSDLPLAVELRNRSWFEPAARGGRTLEFLIDKEIALVAADFGSDESAPVLLAEATGPGPGLARLHGRSADAWSHLAADPVAHSEHHYSEPELESLFAALAPLSEQVDQLDVIVRTGLSTCAPTALRLAELASAPQPPQPDWHWQPDRPQTD